MIIKEFQGQYRFLSNFWPAYIVYDSYEFNDVETAYQYSKFDQEEICEEILTSNSPGEAKKIARKYQNFIRPNFHVAKIGIMLELLRSKFRNEDLERKLLDTNDAVLQEGNRWGDTFWGIDLRTGVGNNNLGKLLMRVREERKQFIQER